MKVAVVGSGAWGTALAIRLCKNGHDVTMWTFEKDLIPQMVANRHNPRLPSVVLPEGLKISGDYACVSGCKLVNSGPLGVIPAHTSDMETTVENLLFAGDAAGIEEASTALDEGRLAGTRAAYKLGFLTDEEYEAAYETIMKRLNTLRAGPFGERRRLLKEAVWNSMK